ncbi:unnamed protein product [Ilex paraguariensis]|uniref:Pectinesterase n=1 Tax=Ilex paraguariensis TaxID=185542 RepID=A0ABC8THR4_9AQUA
MADKKTSKLALIGISSLLLVAMVVAVTVGIVENYGDKTGNYNHHDVSAPMKAIKSICQSTDYQETCVSSLSSAAGNTTDPKELVKAAFDVATMKIKEAAEKSIVLQKLEKDPRAKEALETCQELASVAVNDLKKSFDKLGDFDVSKFDEVLADIKIWSSGAITYQETCLDGFEDTQGDAGEKMKEALKSSMQLTSNALAIVTEISSVLATMDIPMFQNRRLLSEDISVMGHGDEFPNWLDAIRRRILHAKPKQIKPDLIVAKDGSGKYKTINEALKDIPENGNKTFVLYIKEGVYEEKVQFNSSMTYLMVVGDGPTKTRITGKLNFVDGVATYHTATVAVLGDYFIAKDIGFENSAGPEKHQAVALRAAADKSIFYNCHFDGYQDTLYTHTYRQFYRNCVISGTIDFIFGDSAAIFQNCTMLVRKPLDDQQCIVTAQGRKEKRQPTGLVLQNCTITADPSLYPVKDVVKSYLGRPWKEYSRTIIMESYIDDLIDPQGWLPWQGSYALETLFYTEFNNRGPASSKLQRVQWPGIKELTSARIQRFTASQFIEGKTWIPSTDVPYIPGLIFPPPKENATVKYSPEESDEQNLTHKKDKKSYKSSPDLQQTPVTIEAPAPAPSAGFAFPPESDIAAPTSSPTAPTMSESSFSFEMFFKGFF